jgi:hypothetical protein
LSAAEVSASRPSRSSSSRGERHVLCAALSWSDGCVPAAVTSSMSTTRRSRVSLPLRLLTCARH